MKNLLILMTFMSLFILYSCDNQEVIIDVLDFEDVTCNDDGFWDGSDNFGGFTSGNGWFVNHYTAEYGSWSGFAYSNHTDTSTGDYTNQFSSIAGTGAGLSEQYAVFYYYGQPDTVDFDVAEKITNISLSNSTYAWHVMNYGNMFAKKFGGDDGTDPDWFKLILTPIDESGTSGNSLEIFLADFRSDMSGDDYIIDEWMYIDLSHMGFIKRLVFEIASSDTGDWGINTPAYVCIDYIVGELADFE